MDSSAQKNPRLNGLCCGVNTANGSAAATEEESEKGNEFRRVKTTLTKEKCVNQVQSSHAITGVTTCLSL